METQCDRARLSWKARKALGRARRRAHLRRLNVELLEDRRLLSIGPFSISAQAGDYQAGDSQAGNEAQSSGSVRLLQDLNVLPGDADPRDLVEVDGTLFFTADDDGVCGRELFKSDGTTAGTVMVKDVYPGSDSSFPYELTNMGGTLFFRARSPDHGYELFSSDGTEAGTVVIDVYPGTASSNPSNLTDVGGTLYFSAYASGYGRELWKTDGTAAGTVRVADIYSGSGSSSPADLTEVGGTLFFSAKDDSHGIELWKSDGTTAGTVMVRDILPGGGDSLSGVAADLTDVGGTLFFEANDGTHGFELFRSDGTAAGTVMVKDIYPGNTNDGYLSHLTAMGGTLFLEAYDDAYGYELWKSDGTEAGTVMVKDIYTGSDSANPSYLTNLGGTLYFSAYDGANWCELWKSDGTAAGTVMVKDIYPGGGGSYPAYLASANGTLFFRANGASGGYELWKSDGTQPGTVMVKDIRSGSSGSYPRYLTSVNGTVYFSADDGFAGEELFKSDGTQAGTVLVQQANLHATGSSNPEEFVQVGTTTFFACDEGGRGRELFKSDGTEAGTVMVKDIYPGGGSSYPENLTKVGGRLFFTAYAPGFGQELFVSDGTEAGTVMVKDIRDGGGGSYPRYLTASGSALFFQADDGTHGRELFKSDGTQAGTVLVKDIYPGGGAGYPYLLTDVAGTLFFEAYDEALGYELFKSDGTEAGTAMVRDIYPGRGSSNPRDLIDVGGTLFLRAFDQSGGYELFKSDGTQAGTVMVKDIYPGGSSSYPEFFTNVGGTLLFSAYSPGYGTELFKSDGTEAGTVLVKDIRPGSGSSDPEVLTGTEGLLLFFSADDGTNGRELFSSDGTAPGTALVRDVNPGAAGSDPHWLTDVHGTVYFAANDGTHGTEFWQSNGTHAGTLLAGDIRPGSDGSEPRELAYAAGTLYFSANDGVVAREPWIVRHAAYPLTLGALDPPGSLIYGRSTSGTIGVSGSTETYTVDLDASVGEWGQTVSIAVDPQPTLRPVVELFDPAGVSIGSATAGAAGEDAVVQLVATAAAGTYTVTVGGEDATAGTYQMQVVVNAAVEQEQHDGPANDDAASAEDLDASFTAIGSGVSQRGAVTGGLWSRVVTESEDFESGALGGQWSTYSSQPAGRIQVTGAEGAADGSYALLMDCSPGGSYALNEAVWTVDLSGASAPVLKFSHAEWDDEERSFDGDFTDHFDADGVAISSDGVNWHPVWDARDQDTGVWQEYTIDLAAEVAALRSQGAGITLGADFRVKFQQYDNSSLTGDGRGYDRVSITVPGPSADWYRFSMEAGQSATLAMATPGGGRLELYDADSNLLAVGLPATNAQQVIGNFPAAAVWRPKAAAAGTYFARVSQADADYNLVVTLDADFDTEPNDEVAPGSQDVSLSGRVLGDVVAGPLPTKTAAESGEFAEDFLLVRANSGDELAVATYTPCDGPLEPVNLLDPAIELYDPDGSLVAADTNGAPDGRNARLTHTASSSGEYSIRVHTENNTRGEYVLEVGGHSGPLPPFEVAASNPADGETVGAEVTTFTVDFNHAVLATSLEASDLGIDGAATAVGVELLDGDTAAFRLPPLGDGLHSVTIAAGAVSDLQGTPLGAFTSRFSFDPNGPRVIASSLFQRQVIHTGDLVYTVRFDDELDQTNLDSGDVGLVGLVSGVHTPTTFDYNPAGSILTLQYAQLPDDLYTLTLTSGDGAFEDLIGQDLDGSPSFPLPSGDGVPGGDFVVGFSADGDNMAPYTEPLQAQEPLGSLVYDARLEGAIGVGDTDGHTFDLDAGQTITVVIDADDTLQMATELFGPGLVSLAETWATAPGETIVYQTIAAAVPGTYVLALAGMADTVGGYRVRLVLGAAAEEETYGGPSNDDAASAQDLDAAFTAPTTEDAGAGSVERAAVFGTLPPTLGVEVRGEGFESGSLGPQWTTYSSLAQGRVQVTGVHGTADGAYALLMDRSPDGSYNLNEAIWTVDLSGTGEATLSFSHAEWGDEQQPFAGNFVDHQDADGVAISDDGVNWHPVWDAVDQPSGSWQQYSVDLAAEAAAAGITIGADFRVKFQQYDDYPLTSDGRGYDRIAITTPEQNVDWFGFSLDAGRSATLALATQSSGGASLGLYDGGGNLLAMGAAAGNAEAAIDDYVSPAGDTLLARVAGNSTDYSLVVIRDAGFDTEPNDDLPSARELAGSQSVLGYLAGAAPEAKGPESRVESGRPTVDAGGSNDEGPGVSTVDSSASYVPGRLIVRYADSLGDRSKSASVLKDLEARLGGKVVRRLPIINGAVVELADTKADVRRAAAAWSADPDIEYAEPDYLVYALETVPDDPDFSDLWGMHNTGQTGGTPDADIDAPQAWNTFTGLKGVNSWNTFTGSSAVVVASIDTGVDYNHEDLAGNMWTNPGEVPGDLIDNDGNGYVDDVYGIDAANGDSDPWDDAGHGTHTAGTIGAVGDNSIGVAGVAWQTQIMALKFLDAGGSGFTADAITCLEYMTMMKLDYGVNVVVSNNSWGGGGFSQALMDAIAESNHAGVLFVAAAGNDGQNTDLNPHYPSSYDLEGIVSVAATDHNDLKASFSNYGAVSVDLGAPGDDTFSTTPGNNYGYKSGTSMASPHVAGAVGLLMAYSPAASIEETKAAILDTVDPVPDLLGRTLTGGRLNLASALAVMGDPGDYYHFEVNAGDVLAIATGTPYCRGMGPADPCEFHNRLDPAVELYDPAGTLVAEDDNGAADGRNAMLTHTAAQAGTYTVRVLSQAELGEYLLHVTGNTGGQAEFEAVGTDPADGQPVAVAPDKLTVHFSDLVLVGSLDAADLTLGGNQTATGVNMDDGDTVIFDLPALGEGTYQVEIAAGEIQDLQGTPIEPYSGQFTVDLTGPRVVDSSIQEGDVVLPGDGVGRDLLYTVSFDEQLSDVDLDPSDVTLTGASTDTFAPDVFNYDPANSRLTLQYSGLPEDDYTLTLLSGDGAFEDLVGHDLDGEPAGWPIPPGSSGDGTPGGDFFISFSLDVLQTEAGDFQKLLPLGGLMSRSTNDGGLINSVADEDDYTFYVEAGQTITAAAYPEDPTTLLSIQLITAGSPVPGLPLPAPGPGLPAVLPVQSAVSAGDYAVRVAHVSGGDHARYRLDIGLNLALEVADTADGTELNISDSRVALGVVTLDGGRWGAVGSSTTSAPAVDSMVWGVQPAAGRIVLIDPATAEVLHGFAAPDALAPGHTQIGLSIAEDGQSLLYLNSDVDPASLYRLNPLTGAVLSVETTDGLSYDGLGYEPQTQTEVVVYSADMDADPQWTLEGQWAYGVPASGGSHDRDPTSGHSGNNVIGYNLAGDYPDDMPVYYATTPAIDASAVTDCSLSFYRWLGVEASGADEAAVEVSNDGASWTTVWQHDGGSISETSWGQQTYDISAVADGQATVYVRWSMGPTDSSVTYPGWNIDDVTITGSVTEPLGIFLGHRGVEVRRQEAFSGAVAAHFSVMRPSGAIGGDGAGRQFAHVPGTGIVEFDPQVPQTAVNTLAVAAAGIEGLAFDGTGLFAATTAGQLITYHPDTAAVLGSVTVPGGPLYALGAAAVDFSLPDVDAYQLDLTGKAGHNQWTGPIDVVLAGHDGVDFSGGLLQLLDTDGTTVLATAVADPLGPFPEQYDAENYDLAILDFTVPADGVYTLRLTATAEGDYGVIVTDRLVFDSEPNNDPADPLRSLDGTAAALGSLSGGSVSSSAQSGLYYVWDWNTDNLFTVDQQGTVTPLGPAGGDLSISGLAYDSRDAVMYGSSSAGQLWTFDLHSGAATTLGSLPMEINSGMAYSPLDDFLYSVTSSGALVQIDPDNMSAQVVSGPGPGTGAGGIAVDPVGRRIYAHSNSSPRVYSYDAVDFSGPVVHATPANSPHYGMAVNDGELILGPGDAFSGGTNRNLFTYDPDTGAVVQLLPDGQLNGLGFNALEVTGSSRLDVADRYQVTLAAGDTLVIHTQTPYDDATGTPANDLNPALELYDPSAALVASDHDTQDGKNSRLVLTAADSQFYGAGTYTIAVLAEEGTGEYLLLTEIFSQPLPLLTVADVEVVEGDVLPGDGGPTQAGFVVGLSADPAALVTVQLDTYDGTQFLTENGAATAAVLPAGGGDYLPVSGRLLTFSPGGPLTQTVLVEVTGDTSIERREDFFARLSGPSGAILADPHAVGTILNDDTEISIAAGPVVLLEGDANVTPFDFELGLVAPCDVEVTLDYATLDGTATAADLDYLPVGGRLTFAAGEIQKTLTVEIPADTQIEPHEDFFVDFGNASQPLGSGAVDVRVGGRILNDDTAISIDDVTLAEGQAGTTHFDFTVSLAVPVAVPVTVQVDTADGTAAAKDHDYLPIVGKVLTFAADQITPITVRVSVVGDAKIEGDETFWVDLNHASQRIARSQGLGTILGDDLAAKLRWDGLGPGPWDDASRWLVWPDGPPAQQIPDCDTDAVVRVDTLPPAATDVVAVADDRAARDLTIQSGTVDVAAQAELTVCGDLQIEAAGGYTSRLDLLPENGLIDVAGEARLAGTLQLIAMDYLVDFSDAGVYAPGAWPGDQTRTVLSADAVVGSFDQVPDAAIFDPVPMDPILGHLGKGVFVTDRGANCAGVSYHLDAAGPDVVQVDVFQAAPGDVNGDRKIGSLDIQQILSSNTFATGQPADWTSGDFNGDGLCDSLDVQMILATNLFAEGVYAPGFCSAPAPAETAPAAPGAMAGTAMLRALASGVQPGTVRAAAHDAVLGEAAGMRWVGELEPAGPDPRQQSHRRSTDEIVDRLMTVR